MGEKEVGAKGREIWWQMKEQMADTEADEGGDLVQRSSTSCQTDIRGWWCVVVDSRDDSLVARVDEAIVAL